MLFVIKSKTNIAADNTPEIIAQCLLFIFSRDFLHGPRHHNNLTPIILDCFLNRYYWRSALILFRPFYDFF